ncbi:FecCD family ABC transporter permease [Paenibacillus flagellatus]|uniref:Iron ABC transporter permease n=1 Tax=Paenibacillus flagellatus TaxID=2211139 RepID=A0A2V5K8A1_9BACL|nr:iron ABC transporter permease [Paenibacillus flagellatus]PYI55082.1 iron ABC transporter permease [Paenibacillus flagellatus]
MSKYIPFRSKSLKASGLLDKRTLLVACMLAAVTVAVAIASSAIGSMRIHPLSVVRILFGAGDEAEATIVLQFRLPRIVVALLVGMLLAASGAILQGMIRNPLASPDIMGVTGGASAAAVLFITLLPTASIRLLPFAAMVGAVAATAIIYALAWKKGVAAMRLVLIGVGIEASMRALTTLLIVRSPFYTSSKALTWLTGTVYGANWTDVAALAPWALVLLPVAFFAGRTLNVLQLGDDTASSTGSRVNRSRLLLLALCVGLAGAAVAVGGAIGFVALLAPHIARRLVGPSFGGLLPVAVLTGGIIVALADLIARTAFAPLDLPVGIFTSLIGAPFFLYLLYRNRNA